MVWGYSHPQRGDKTIAITGGSLVAPEGGFIHFLGVWEYLFLGVVLSLHTVVFYPTSRSF